MRNWGGTNRKAIVSLTVVTAFLLTGCVAGANTTSPEKTTAPTESQAAPQPVNVESISIGELDDFCAGTEKALDAFDDARYTANLELIKKEPDMFVVYRQFALKGFEDLKSPDLKTAVRGPSIVASQKFLAQSSATEVKNLEQHSRASFLGFVERVFEEILVNCGLGERYRAVLELLSEGQLLVAEGDARLSGQRTGQNPDLNFGTQETWRSSGIFEWRWGGTCESGFGYCKEVQVRSATDCKSIYVEANVSSNGIVIESPIASLRNLRAGQIGLFELRGTADADSIVMRDISCF